MAVALGRKAMGSAKSHRVLMMELVASTRCREPEVKASVWKARRRNWFCAHKLLQTTTSMACISR